MRVAIVGAGQISRQHMACLQGLPGVEITAVCDLSRTVAEAAADRFRVPRWDTDHCVMLREVAPEVVHVTTPPASHFRLASDAIEAGAHVIVEKPATTSHRQTIELLELAQSRKRILIENYNYIFNSQVQRILAMIEDGSFGQVVHVEVLVCLPVFASGSAFADRNLTHHSAAVKGGAVADFLPHLASLAHVFVGPHRAVATIWRKGSPEAPDDTDEFRALINAERGTALIGFSANAQPDVFSVRVEGTRMRASANLFETRLLTEPQRSGPKQLTPFLNGLQEARQARRSAYSGLRRKLSGGPGAYEGLWEMLARTYRALQGGAPPPITDTDVRAVNDLVEAVIAEGGRL